MNELNELRHRADFLLQLYELTKTMDGAKQVKKIVGKMKIIKHNR